MDHNAENRQKEFVELLSKNSRKLQTFTSILALNNQDVADEIFQKTSITMWEKFHNFEPGSNFSAWGCRIAQIEFFRFRAKNKKLIHLDPEAIQLLSKEAITTVSTVDDRRIALLKCVQKLDDSKQGLVNARYFEGRKAKELAEQTGRSIHSIYRELKRIHHQLSICIKRTIG